MARPVVVPRLGWSMEEGTFAGWLKADGDVVRAGEPIFRLESDKAVEEIESLDSGVLRIAPGGPREGDKVKVGAVLGHLVAKDEAAPVLERATASAPASKAPAAVPTPAGPAARRLARQQGVDLRQVTGKAAGGRITSDDVQGHLAAAKRGSPAVSPRARRAARQLGIDTAQLTGTGHNGRVRERDVLAAAATGAPAAPVSSIRRAIADRLVESLRTTAPVTLTTTVDAANLVNLRTQFKAAGGEVPSYTDFLVKLAALALQQHPDLNAHWENDRVVRSPAIHVGVAVDTDAGLLVPVLEHADRLTVRDLAVRSRELAQKARERRLTAQQMQGGTFTVTNLGSYGIDAFTPIIPPGQCAILGVGAIRREAVVHDDRIVPGERITLSLTFDHRIVDGAPAARFLQALARLVENPAPCLVP